MGLGFRYRPVRSGAKFLLIVAAMTAEAIGTALMAQAVPRAADGGIPTLHVYTNLVQVPTLVLTTANDLVGKRISEDRFSVSIDSGRWFRATHVREEGDDPISLSILLDVKGDIAALLPKMGDAIGNLAPASLHGKDRVSVYALDCSLVRSLNDMPPYRAVLESGVAAVLERSTARKGNQRETHCELRGHLWDALAQVAARLSDLPGRRVILVVTDGHDTGSKRSWNEVRYFAQVNGIAVFALNYAPASQMGIENYRSGRGGYVPSAGTTSGIENSLIELCELSGGIVTRFREAQSLPSMLDRFVTMVRERYIVEFPRPTHSTAGEHDLRVKIDKGVYSIWASGVSVPLPDPAVVSDPATIQAGPSQAPEEGKRKVMNKPQ
jgi:hypothetical protein